MKIEEMRAKIETKTTEVRGFVEKNEAEKAKAGMKELRELKANLKIAEELEGDEKRDLENQRDNKKEERGNKNMKKVNEFRSTVKYAMGEKLTDEERAMIKTIDNSAIIPKQFINELIEIQKGYGSLKYLCDTIPVNKSEGTIPIVDLDQNEMVDISEGEDIVDGTLVTKDVPFKCSKVGLKQIISSETLEDTVVNVESLIKKNFANIATVKENSKILKVIKDNADNIIETTDYTDVEKTIDSALPSVKRGIVTLTNLTGYVDLKNKKDKQGRSLNLVTNVGGVDYFHEKPIVYVENELLPITTEGKTQVFYVLNWKEVVKFIDRKVTTVKKWEDNDNDTSKMSILERIGAVKGSTRSLKKIEL